MSIAIYAGCVVLLLMCSAVFSVNDLSTHLRWYLLVWCCSGRLGFQDVKRPNHNEVVIMFVVGGITFQEVQALREESIRQQQQVVQAGSGPVRKVQLFIGSTELSDPVTALTHVLRSAERQFRRLEPSSMMEFSIFD